MTNLLLPLSQALLYALAAAGCTAIAAAAALALARSRTRAHGVRLERLRAELVALRSENGSQTATLVALAARLAVLQRQLAAHAAAGPGHNDDLPPDPHAVTQPRACRRALVGRGWWGCRPGRRTVGSGHEGGHRDG